MPPTKGIESFRSKVVSMRVHSIETKGPFDRSRGFDRRVSDDNN